MAEPPVRWMPSLRAERRRRARRWLGWTAIGLALAGLAAAVHFGLAPPPRLVWNPSASAPVGLWRIHPGKPVTVGDMVLAEPPERARRLAAERRYLPGNVAILKRVAAAQGDHVCLVDDVLAIDGRPLARLRTVDGLGRPMPRWRDCRTLREGEYLLLMDAADSFDGRYFGPVDASAIIGKATPLWVR